MPRWSSTGSSSAGRAARARRGWRPASPCRGPRAPAACACVFWDTRTPTPRRCASPARRAVSTCAATAPPPI
ncbi:hypothetical protein DRV84_14035 [Rhodosalinus sediminis]|uniref:Uncharacterized protein n=1 Tax=Rhodosalinus sediminis TaxID=1940533 RepID=A0A3D9BLM9_9RHOB|nr:hypothetical protein DRV84_14035 [Rhodosalinus sediminis]